MSFVHKGEEHNLSPLFCAALFLTNHQSQWELLIGDSFIAVKIQAVIADKKVRKILRAIPVLFKNLNST